ncbi:DNA polymerase [Hyphomicrobium nitrativorans NL23]|uniref:DNA polymerase n=1 Tax=Hyphomicrobium nitrativorans NL23 TaxID=1029756 RepID=V5SB92_9HYPH|nr:non-homologous end-joining DNA ligase [Hyphomicrobium nitrativorans]AHB48166.1 DNA polymerase [Hyphomicrobium nitrativorans NL23]
MARSGRKSERSRNTLLPYRAKRDFTRTEEPSGAQNVRPGSYPRFVIQKHDATRLHYDLRLEIDGAFKCWAVTRGPSLDPGEKRLAVEVEDHPLDYGDFEGTIPKGEYGGGTVMVWDRGFWLPEGDKPVRDALRDGELKLVLAGSKLQGGWVLVRMKRDRTGSKRNNWLFIKHRDIYARGGDNDALLKQDRSVASDRTMAEIAKGTGRAPEAFMLDGRRRGKADAIWHSQPIEKPRSQDATAVLSVKISNPDRVLWPRTKTNPATTKRDLARYLEAIGPWMIGHLAGRPCSVVRAPDGIKGEIFFQRHALQRTPEGVTEVEVGGDRKPYIQIDSVEGLVGMAQMSALEFHPWNSAPDATDVPGRLVFDLDPGSGVAFDDVVAAAIELRGRLEKLGLVPFCKTTGGKGLHVTVPLDPKRSHGIGWDEAKMFAQTVCAQMAHDSPDRYLIKMTRSLRRRRIFLDYLRNDRMATAVAPLSPRARPGALVSMPLTWGQVRRGLDPSRFTLRTVPKLIARSEAWRDYDSGARSLKDAIRRLVGAKR